MLKIWKRICRNAGRSFFHLRFYMQVLVVFLFIAAKGYSQATKTAKFIVYFQTASFSIDSGESRKLDSVFSIHKIISIISIEGYTDSVDGKASNLTLSQKRSKTVEAWVQSKFPDVKRGSVKFYGEASPVSLSDNASNRRVELIYSWEDSPGIMMEKKEKRDTMLVSTLKLDKLYFIPDKAILDPGSIDYLNQMIDLLKKYPQARFEIRGHVNKPPYNKKSEGFERQMQQLSEDRAKFVYQACLEHGIAAERMSYKGMGSSEMEYPNPKNDDEKRMNMRVEILVFEQHK